MGLGRLIGIFYIVILVLLIISIFFHFAIGLLFLLLLGWGLLFFAFFRFEDKKIHINIWKSEILINFFLGLVTLTITQWIFFNDVFWDFNKFIFFILFLSINISFIVIIILIIVEHRLYILKEKLYNQYLEQKKKSN